MEVNREVHEQSLAILRYLQSQEALERPRFDRLSDLCDEGKVLGFSCADGNYSRSLEKKLGEVANKPHFLQLNGTGFKMGLEPDDGRFNCNQRLII